jgi:alpha-tubulin suppressor-like RCC1 family protein
MNLLIIHKDVPDIPFITSNILPEINYIIVDLENDNLKNIIKDIQKIYKDNNIDKIENIGLVRHNVNPAFIQNLSTQDIEKVDPELDSWIKFSSFLFRLRKMGCKNFDLISCNCYTDDWKYIINYYKDKYGINIRSSVNITGAGGDWILESDNVDLVNLYFNPNIINYRYSLESISAPYDVVLVKNYNTGRGTFDVLYGYGKNTYGQFGTGYTYENFTEYTLLGGTLGKYSSLNNPLKNFSGSYMNTLIKNNDEFILSGNFIEPVNESYRVWQDYFEKEYPFNTQTNIKKGGSQMTLNTSFIKTQKLKNIKYYEIGISSIPQLITYGNMFEDADLAAAALAKKYGFKWTIKTKYEEWIDWFEEEPLTGSISYADKMLLAIGKILNRKDVQILLIILTVITTILTMGGGAVWSALPEVLKLLSKFAVKEAFKTLGKAIISGILKAVDPVTGPLSKIMTSLYRLMFKAAASSADDAAAQATKAASTSLLSSISNGITTGLDKLGKIVLDNTVKAFTKNANMTFFKTATQALTRSDDIIGIARNQILSEKAKQQLQKLTKQLSTDACYVSLTEGSTPTLIQRGLVNYVTEDEPSYISKPGKPFHKNQLLKPANWYTQTPTNDGYFIVYLDEFGVLWGVGDNTHGQIGPKIWNMQKNYGPGMPKQYTNVPNQLKIALLSTVIGIISAAIIALTVAAVFGFFVVGPAAIAGIAILTGILVALSVALGQLVASAGTAYFRILGGGAYPVMRRMNQILYTDNELLNKIVNKSQNQQTIIKHVSCGDGYIIALGNDGKLYGSGKNLYYQMPGSTEYYSYFGLTQLPEIEVFKNFSINIQHIVCGPNHVAIMVDTPRNDVYITGDTTYGQAGIIDDEKYTIIFNHLIDKKTNRYGVKACLTGPLPIKLFIPNEESVLQVCCGEKCSVILTEERNVYVYGFGFMEPRNIYLKGGVSLTIFNSYVPEDIEKEMNDASNSLFNALDNMTSNPTRDNIGDNLQKIFTNNIDTNQTINYPIGTTSINYEYFDRHQDLSINIIATKNYNGTWSITMNPVEYSLSLFISINETESNVDPMLNIPKFVKVVNDTIILYCTDKNDTIDNIVHVDANNITGNITANQIPIDNKIRINGSRIIAGIYYFGHTFTYMLACDYKFNDLNTYYQKELAEYLATSSFDSVSDYINFGVDLLTIIKLNRFTIEEFRIAGVNFRDLFGLIYDVSNYRINVNSIIDASWSISDYLDAGLTFTELWTNITFRNLKNRFTIYDYIKEGSIPINELLSQCSWLKVKDFFENGRHLGELYKAGFNTFELLEGGYSIFTFPEAKIPVSEIPKSLGYNVELLMIAGYSLMDLFDASYCSAAELKNSNISINDIYSLKLEDIRAAGFTLNELINSPFSIYYIYSIPEYINAGYSLSDLREAQVHINQIIFYMNISNQVSYFKNEITLKDIRNAGYTVNDLKPFNYKIPELKNAGYTVKEMREANYTITQLKVPQGYNDIELFEGGFSLIELGYKKSSLNLIKYNGKIVPYKINN